MVQIADDLCHVLRDALNFCSHHQNICDLKCGQCYCATFSSGGEAIAVFCDTQVSTFQVKNVAP